MPPKPSERTEQGLGARPSHPVRLAAGGGGSERRGASWIDSRAVMASMSATFKRSTRLLRPFNCTWRGPKRPRASHFKVPKQL